MSNIEKVLYTGNTHVSGGRDGRARSADGRLNVLLASPGSKWEGTNPEQLLGAGWGACYLGALGIVAKQAGIALSPDTAVDVEIDLGLNGTADYQLQARMRVLLPDLDPDTARQLTTTAHTVCPYSKALHGNIDIVTVIA